MTAIVGEGSKRLRLRDRWASHSPLLTARVLGHRTRPVRFRFFQVQRRAVAAAGGGPVPRPLRRGRRL
jgi:hypothetical protein